MGQEIMGLNCKKEQVKLDLRGKKNHNCRSLYCQYRLPWDMEGSLHWRIFRTRRLKSGGMV